MSLLWRPETPVLFVSTRDARLRYYAYYYEEIMKQITDQAFMWGARTPRWFKYFKLEGYDITKTEAENEQLLNTPTGAIFSKPSYYRSDPKPVESFRMEFTPLLEGIQQLIIPVPGRNNTGDPKIDKFWLPDYTVRNYYWDMVEYLARYLNTMNVSLTEKQKSDNWCLLERWGISGAYGGEHSSSVLAYRSWTHNSDRAGFFNWNGWDTLFRDWHNPLLGFNFQNFKDYTNELPPLETVFFEKTLDVHLDFVRPRWVMTFPKGIGIGVVDLFSAEYTELSDEKHLVHDGNLRDQNYSNVFGIKFLLTNNWIMSNSGHIRSFNSRGEALKDSLFLNEKPEGDSAGYALYSGLNVADYVIFRGGFGDPNDRSVLYLKGGSLYVRAMPNPPTTITLGPERGPIKIRIVEYKKYGAMNFAASLNTETKETFISSFNYLTDLGGGDCIVKESNSNKFWNLNAFLIPDPVNFPNKIYAVPNVVAKIDVLGTPIRRPAPVFFKGQVKNDDSVVTYLGETNWEMLNSSFARNLNVGALKQYETQTLVKAYDDRLAGMYDDQVGVVGSGDWVDLWVLRTYGYPQPWSIRETLKIPGTNIAGYFNDSNVSYWGGGDGANTYDVAYRKVYRFTFNKWWDANKLKPLNCAIDFRYTYEWYSDSSIIPNHCSTWQRPGSITIKAFMRDSGIINATDWALGETVHSFDLGANGKDPKTPMWYNFDIPISLDYGKDLIIVCIPKLRTGHVLNHIWHAVSTSAILSFGGDPEVTPSDEDGYGNNNYGDDYGN